MQDPITKKLNEIKEDIEFVKDCRVSEQNFGAASAYRDLGEDLKKIIQRAEEASKIQPPPPPKPIPESACYTTTQALKDDEIFLGRGVVQQAHFVDAGTIAGCVVTQAVLCSGVRCRVIRKNEVIHDGYIDFLKQFKNTVEMVKEGSRCGVKVYGFDDINAGDMIDCYKKAADTPK